MVPLFPPPCDACGVVPPFPPCDDCCVVLPLPPPCEDCGVLVVPLACVAELGVLPYIVHIWI